MEIVSNIREIRIKVSLAKKKGLKIGFVPTMGFLHQGHLSLVEAAKKECDYVVVSIFVNPTQFGPREDFNKYPRDIKRDIKMLETFSVDVVFYPQAEEMYPPGFASYIDPGKIGDMLCGESRPGHFRGVATIVVKLFNIVEPDTAYFGEKDFQQQVIIKNIVQDLDIPVRVVSLPTVRESDGLAMSSRNKYLTKKQRAAAPLLYQSLVAGKKMVKDGEKRSPIITRKMRVIIAQSRLINLEYIKVVDPSKLEPVKKIVGRALIVLAAKLGKTRLIDNIVL